MMLVAESARTSGRSEAREIAGLTSIRGLAAWWVVLFHFWFWLPRDTPKFAVAIISHGYFGVDLFFVLSGYVIALNYADKLKNGDVRSWGDFLWRRIARIYPLHLFMLLLFALTAAAVFLFANRGVPRHQYDFGYLLLSVALVQNWGFTHVLEWNLPAWSISVEWLAYIIFPALLWLARVPLQNRLACWIMAFSSLALLGVLTPFFLTPDHSMEITQLGPIRGVLEFWAGACLFHARRGGSMTPTRVQLAFALAMIGICCGIAILFRVNDYAFVPAAFLFLVWALSFPSGILARLMGGASDHVSRADIVFDIHGTCVHQAVGNVSTEAAWPGSRVCTAAMPATDMRDVRRAVSIHRIAWPSRVAAD